MQVVIKLNETESQFWDSDLVERLTSIPDFGGCHSEQPGGEGGYLCAPDDEPEGDYQVVLDLVDEKYTFYYTTLAGFEQAIRLLDQEASPAPRDKQENPGASKLLAGRGDDYSVNGCPDIPGARTS